MHLVHLLQLTGLIGLTSKRRMWANAHQKNYKPVFISEATTDTSTDSLGQMKNKIGKQVRSQDNNGIGKGAPSRAHGLPSAGIGTSCNPVPLVPGLFVFSCKHKAWFAARCKTLLLFLLSDPIFPILLLLPFASSLACCQDVRIAERLIELSGAEADISGRNCCHRERKALKSKAQGRGAMQVHYLSSHFVSLLMRKRVETRPHGPFAMMLQGADLPRRDSERLLPWGVQCE